MKTVYDMGSGQVLEYGLAEEATQPVAPDAFMPELQLQLVVAESSTEREIPPELVLADLNAFLEKMS